MIPDFPLLGAKQGPHCGADSLRGASDMRENAMQANCQRSMMEGFWKRKPHQSLKAIQLSVTDPVLGLGDQIQSLELC